MGNETPTLPVWTWITIFAGIAFIFTMIAYPFTTGPMAVMIGVGLTAGFMGIVALVSLYADAMYGYQGENWTRKLANKYEEHTK